jgi:hypothetical protein
MVHVRAARDTHPPLGERLRFHLDPAMIRFFDAQTEQALPQPAATAAVSDPAAEVAHG